MSEPPKQKPWDPRGGTSSSGGAGRPNQPRRPLGITIVCVLNFVVAALFVILVVLALANGSGNYELVLLALLPIVISVGLGIALWQMQPWARNTALVLYGVYALSGVLNLFSRPGSIGVNEILTIAIPAAIVAYLLQPDVRDAFDPNLRR